jgi:hypothetical protein
VQGIAYQQIEKSDFAGEAAEYEIFNFALINAKKYAEMGQCCALRQALTFWKTRSYGFDINKEAARNRIIKTQYYTDCEIWLKSASCRKTR